MTKRSIEHSPHFSEKPLKFGEPLPKRKRTVSGSTRKPLSQTQAPSIWESSEDAVEEVVVEVKEKKKREWEKYILDKGSGTQETIEGRSYTIGRNHSPIDVWTSPPDTWGAKRIATIKDCRIITLKKEKPSKAVDSSDPQARGWTQAVVIEGTSARPNMLIPRTFNDGTGSRMYISVEWSQITRRK